MSIAEKENDLFERWAVDRKEFVKDGLIDEKSYLESEKKILFVLKEANDITGGDWDLREFIRNGARPQTWDNITRWTMGIRSLTRDIPWHELENISNEDRINALKSICVMNVKKSPGGSVPASQDKVLLKEQFLLYNPDIIICCGSVANDIFESFFTEPLNWQLTDRGIKYSEYEPNKYLVSYCRPDARVQNPLLYYGLADAVREIIKKQKTKHFILFRI